MKTLKFYKDYHSRWYVDLPEWPGDNSALEMVAGADDMLDYIGKGKNEVFLTISEVYFEGADVIQFIRNATELEGGAFYVIDSYCGEALNLEMWLCDVMLFVFGKFPENIYIK